MGFCTSLAGQQVSMFKCGSLGRYESRPSRHNHDQHLKAKKNVRGLECSKCNNGFYTFSLGPTVSIHFSRTKSLLSLGPIMYVSQLGPILH